MKTKVILGVLLFCLSGAIVAQQTDSNVNYPDTMPSKPTKKAKFWIGPKFGLDLSPVKFSDIGNQLSGNYQIGLFMQFGRTLYLQPEFYYASYKITPSVGSSESKSSNFIKLPVMIGLKFIDLGLFSLHAMTGPAFSFQLGDNDSFSGNNAFSWQVGAGVDILGFITTDLRYTLDKNQSLGDQINNFSTENSMLNLTVGLKFR